jgi:hypothetical protein
MAHSCSVRASTASDTAGVLAARRQATRSRSVCSPASTRNASSDRYSPTGRNKVQTPSAIAVETPPSSTNKLRAFRLVRLTMASTCITRVNSPSV